ncbi:hypothetical protein [Mycolicibacterium insubricum]|nr:hypothetical protein [Mycolicibacterium insubricum]
MDADNLPSLLSSPAEVSQLTGVSDLTLGQVYDAPARRCWTGWR